MEKPHAGHFVTRLWRVVAWLLLLLSILIGQSIYTSRSQHEEQAVVETYSVARVLESDLGNLVDKVRLAVHTVATEQERRLAGRGSDEQAARAYITNIRTNLPDLILLDVMMPDIDGFEVLKITREVSSVPVIKLFYLFRIFIFFF